MKKNNFTLPDQEFRKFTAIINRKIQDNKSHYVEKDREKVNIRLVNKLAKLELSFKNSLANKDKTYEIYEKFIDFVHKDLGNTLLAQPYFREKKQTINKEIFPAIKLRNAKDLFKFHANYQLIAFIVENWKGTLPETSFKIYENIVSTRNMLIENNIPLAINQAKIFFRSVKGFEWELLDYVNICITGLISGIDKYVGKYEKVWATVCIGRMVGFLIKEHTESLVKMYPIDKKILYRINVIRYRMKIEEIGELTKAVNESFLEDSENGMSIPKLPITQEQIVSLINAVDYRSINSVYHRESERGAVVVDVDLENSLSDNNLQSESLIDTDAEDKMKKTIKSLDMLPKKVIQLKGVQI